MKLILCSTCSDIVKLHTSMLRTCLCGASWGRYLNDGHTATYGGKAVPLGILNSALEAAVLRVRGGNPNRSFTAFVFGDEEISFKKG